MRALLTADEQFLMTFEEKCQMTDEEWEERQKTRQLEMDKELKATAILIRDDDHDLFTRTFRLSLLQKSIAMHSERKTQASELLSAMADRRHSSRLATLAFRICLDAFTRVKKVMDDMIPALRSKSVHVVISDFQCLDKDCLSKAESKVDKCFVVL